MGRQLPGRLGAIGIHEALRWNVITRSILYCNNSHSLIISNRRVTELWISVDIEEKPARACSGCAGDYEDPDRSAWEKEWLGRLLELARGCIRPGRTQRETLPVVLRLAATYEQWVTLAELAEKTKFPPASISAQLRHLRKAEYGGWR